MDPGLALEHWVQPGAVYTVNEGYTGRRQFPDVRQWIELLRLFSQFPPQLSKPKRKGDEELQNEENSQPRKRHRYNVRAGAAGDEQKNDIPESNNVEKDTPPLPDAGGRYVTVTRVERRSLHMSTVKVDEYENIVSQVVEYIDRSIS
jgi:hypothetical protein